MATAYGLTKKKKTGEDPIVTQVAEEEVETKEEPIKGGFLGGLGYLGGKVASSAVQSIEGAVDYIGAGLNKWAGNDKRAEEIIANDWFGDWYTRQDEKYQPNEAWKVAGDIAGGIGTSLPGVAVTAALALVAAGLTAAAPVTGGTSIAGAAGAGSAAAATAATTAAGVAKAASAASKLVKIAKGVKVAAKVATPVVAGLGAAGTATKEAYQQTGELTGKEFAYGAGSGIVEGGLETVGNFIGAGSGALVKRMTGNAAKSITRTTLVKGMAKGFVDEALEEGISEFLSPYIARMTYDPSAENASLGEIGYAAFVGGVSGSLFGAVDVGVSSAKNLASGARLSGQENGVYNALHSAEAIIDSDSSFPLTAKSKETLQKLYDRVKMTSAMAGSMPHLDINQKGALGALNTMTAAATLQGVTIQRAMDIAANAENYVDRFNTLGYVDGNGNPMSFTAEGLRSGLENIAGVHPELQADVIYKALMNNPALRVVAVASVAGTMSLNTDTFADAVMERGFTGMTAEDIDRFAETATDEQKAAVQEMLGIPDIRAVSAPEMAMLAEDFNKQGGAKYYKERKAFVSEMERLKGKTARKIPKGITIADGSVVHYKDVDADIAVKRTGDTYSIYDYDSKVTLRGLSKSDVNKLLREYRANTDAKVDTDTNTEQKPKKIVDENYENAKIPDKHMSIDEALQKEGITRLQKKSLKILKKVAKALDVKMRIYESPLVEQRDKNGNVVKDKDGNPIMVREGANGMFDPNTDTIYIDLYASVDGKGTMLYTASHELTHFVKKWNEAEFEIFKEFLEKHYLKSGQSFNQLARVKMREARADKRSISFETAMEEVVADTCEKMLSDPDVVQKLTTEKKTHFKMVTKVVNWLKTQWQKLTNMYHGVAPDSYEANYFAAMGEAYDNVKGMWVDLVKGAKANFDAAETVTVESTETLRGQQDGAVVKTEVTDYLIEKKDVLSSTRTEKTALPKQKINLNGDGTMLDTIEGVDPTQIAGLGGAKVNAFTGRAIREWAMRLNKFRSEQIKAVNGFMDKMADFMEKAGVTYKFIGLQDVEQAQLHYRYDAEGKIDSIVLSAMVKNGDYPVNFDLSSICKKRGAMSALMDKLAKRGSIDNGTVDLSPASIFQINKALKDAGYETACLGCFVESKRYGSLKWAEEFCTKWNAAVKKVNKDATYFGFGDNSFTEESFTLEQAKKIDDAARSYITNGKQTRLDNALKKYKDKKAQGLPLVDGKPLTVDGKVINTFSKAARKRIADSDTISDVLKEKYLSMDVGKLKMADVVFLLENGVLPGVSLSNKQAVTELVKSGEVYQKLLRPSDLLTDRGIKKLVTLPHFRGVLYGHYGSATPKLMQSYTPYNSEIALLPTSKGDKSLAEYLYSIAGVRMQSFSDFQIQNIYDYLQMVGDLAAQKLPAHAYTKEISFAKLLGMTGMKVNLSVMFDIDATVDEAHAGLTKYNPLVHKGEYAKIVLEDSQGKWVYNIGDYQTQRMFSEAFPDSTKRFLQSIGFADAVKLQSTEGYSANCGIIGVGYSDLAIFAMLDDPRIRYIIPYHASSLPPDIKVATNIRLGTDYTYVQSNTKIESIVDKNGKKVSWTVKDAYKRLKSGQAVINELNEKIRTDGWVVTTKKAQNGHGTYGLYEDLKVTNDPRQTASNFMDWCAKNGTLPLFYQFASHENYYKLVYDFNVYDCITEEYAPQHEVTNTYPAMVDGTVKAVDVADGNFDAEYFQSTIDKQMRFMNEYGRNLDTDLDTLAENLEQGEYSVEQKTIKDGKIVKGLMLSSRSTYSHEGLTEADIASADEVVKRLRDMTRFAKYGVRNVASYTDERMEQEIQNASSKEEMDYAKSYIAWVTPEDFIAATTMTEESRERIKTEAGKLDLEKLQKQKQPIYLHVDFSTGEIVGHEGRHRMLALQDAGISRVAVIIDATNDNRKHTKPIEIKWLGGQNFKYAKGLGFYLHDAIPLSKRYADVAKEMFAFDSKEGVKFQGRSKQTVDFMPKEEYNSYGWVRENDVLTSAQYKDFESKFAKALNGDSYHKTASGEYMIPVSHKGDRVLDGVEYTIVYAKGTIEKPEITRILEIDENDETNLSRIRSQVYAIEQQGVRKKSDGIFTSYTPSDFQSYESAKRRALSAVGNSGRVGLYGGTGSTKTARSAGGVQQQKITGFTNNEDGSQTRFYSDGTSEIKRSDRVSLQKKLYALQDEIHDIKLSDGYNAVIQKVMDAETLAEKKAARAEYDAWEEETHFTEKVREAKAIEEELNAMIKAEEEEAKQKAVAEQSKKIAESGLSEADYFRSEAVKEFGYTPYYNDAGYILPDGRMLNFSGEKGKHFGTRGQDHRAIGMIYAAEKRSAAMLRFMDEGNVRLMAESPGIDLGTSQEPTVSQYNTIVRFISEAKRKGRFYVDFTDRSGHLAGSMEYNGRNVDASVIVDDIKYFFRNGEVRERTDYYDPLYQTRKTYTAGQYQKGIASKSKARIYSKGASIELMKRITMGTKMTPETMAEMTDAVWEYLNKEQDNPMGRDAVADNLADAILEKMLMEGETPNANVNEAKERLAMLRTGIRRLDIRDRYKGDLKFVLDKDGYRKFMARWGLKQNVDKGAYPMDLFVTDIAREVQGLAYLEEMETSDAMLEIDRLYEKAKQEADTKHVALIDSLSGEEIDGFRAEIANVLKMAFSDDKVRYDKTAFVDEVGTALEAIDSKLVWKYAEHEYKYGYPKAVNRVIYAANKIKDIKTRKYKNASEQTTSAFEHLNKSLSSIVIGSNLRSAEHIRLVMADLQSWYNDRYNSILNAENASGERISLHDEHVADMIANIVNSKGDRFTVKELKMVHDVLVYFANFEQRWRKVYRDGKWVDALPIAREYHEKLKLANTIIRSGFIFKTGAYLRAFGDPASVVRRFDAYNDGFFTDMYENIRQGEKDAEIAEMDALKDYDEFLSKHKKYLDDTTEKVVEFRGYKMTKNTLIGLYMTLKRQQAWRGIIENGFRYTLDDKYLYGKGKRTHEDAFVTVKGFANGQVLSEEALAAKVAEIGSEIDGMLDDLDKQYIAILEKSYNEDLRSMKEYRDYQRMGISNVYDGYYYPIRRDLPAKNVDTSRYTDDLDTVSNSSFNKDTVKGAKQALFIDSADRTYRRHARSVCKYAYLSPAIEQFNTLYGIAINENTNAAESIATEARNTWKQGFDYFAKLIKDIEGVRTEEVGSKLLSAVRSGYAVSVLAGNLKVLPTQLSSIFASLNILDAKSITSGFMANASDVDKYCRLAELRNYDSTATRAQALSEDRHTKSTKAVQKIQSTSEWMMKPIGAVDRFVVCRLFGACQVQVAKNGIADIGTEKNKIEAGKLLEKVIFETQQNSIKTEKSAAMRGGELMKSATMFSSDAMKVIGRVIDAFGEVQSIKTQKKLPGANVEQLNIRLKAARKKEARAVIALLLNSLWMAGIARLFALLYNKDEQDSNLWDLFSEEAENKWFKFGMDAISNMFGGLPFVRDIVSFALDGYEPEDTTYSALNDLLNAAKSMTTSVTSGSNADVARSTRTMIYSVSTFLGIPARNLYNLGFGLVKRISEPTAYKIDEVFYDKNYRSDFYKYIDEGDTKMSNYLLGLALGERIGEDLDEDVFNELLRLSQEEYKVMPKDIPTKITIDGEEYKFSAEEMAQIRENIFGCNNALSRVMSTVRYQNYDDETKAEVVNYIFDLYRDNAIYKTVGVRRIGDSALIGVVSANTLSYVHVKTMDGYDRNTMVKAILNSSATKEQKLLLIYAKGYSIKDNELPGITTKNAKTALAQYINSLSLSKKRKEEVAKKCGFKVQNGKIILK